MVAPTLADIWALLEAVPDPEIPVVSIRELGILRDVRRAENALSSGTAIATESGAVEVVITPTYSGCPAMGQIEDDVKAVLRSAGVQAHVVTQLAPAWTTDWLTGAAREKLRAYGIAPPAGTAVASHTAHTSAPTPDAADTRGVTIATKNIAAYARISWAKSPFASQDVPCPRCASHNTTETSHFASTACKALYKCLDCLEPFDYFKPY